MSQCAITIESDGTVRIGGFWSTEYVIVSKSDPTWADPTLVTTTHCWYDSDPSVNQSVTVQLDSPTTMKVAVVAGACPTSIDASQWKTYYR
jgi:hypothetical protein